MGAARVFVNGTTRCFRTAWKRASSDAEATRDEEDGCYDYVILTVHARADLSAAYYSSSSDYVMGVGITQREVM